MKHVEFDTSVLISQPINTCIDIVDKFNQSLQKAVKNLDNHDSRILLIKAGFDPDLPNDLDNINKRNCKIKIRVSVKRFKKNDGTFEYASFLCSSYDINRINVYTIVDDAGIEKVEKIMARG